MAVQHKPDVVLLDIRMPKGKGSKRRKKSGVELRCPRGDDSTYDNPTYVARAVALGAERLRAERGQPAGVDRHDHRGRRGQSSASTGELERWPAR